MIRISDRSTPTCIVVEVEGKVTGEEYESVSEAIEKIIDKEGSVNLVIRLLGSVRYGDFDAVEEDWDFMSDEYRKVRRAAFVGDKGFIQMMVQAFSRITKAEEAFFGPDEIDAAIEWACATT